MPETEPADRFPVRFYLVAMIFIVLDIEIVFLYPFAVVLGDLGAFGLVEMGLFVLAVIVAFGYVLSSGALEWGRCVLPSASQRRCCAPRHAPPAEPATGDGDGDDSRDGPATVDDSEPARPAGRAA